MIVTKILTVQCDLMEPSCGRCARTERSCRYDYKHPLDRISVHKTVASMAKMQQYSNKVVEARNAKSIRDTASFPQPNSSNESHFKVQAPESFCSNSIPRIACPEATIPLLTCTRKSYIHALEACNSALESKKSQSRDQIVLWSSAVSSTSQAMKCSVSKASDALLPSVLLLHLFTRISSTVSGISESSHIHLHNAIRIIDSMGPVRPQNAAGRAVFIAVNTLKVSLGVFRSPAVL